MTYLKLNRDIDHKSKRGKRILLFKTQTHMKKSALPILIAGFLVLLVSLTLLYSLIYFLPAVMEEYYNPVFRSSSFQTDLLFYGHPFVLSLSLYWFWDRFKTFFNGSFVWRAFEIALAYGIIAMLPVLWLTFSAINISYLMVGSWLIYGISQAFVAGMVFAKMNP
jgi:hypothetical protein